MQDNHTTPQDIPLKCCSKCKEFKPTYFFDKHKSHRDGYSSTCRKCRAEHEGREYHPPARPGYRFCCDCKNEFPATLDYFYADRRYGPGFGSCCKPCAKKSASQWGQENREIVIKKVREWRENNFDQYMETTRKWQKKNKDRLSAMAKIRGERWKAENPSAQKAVALRRRARKRSLSDSFTAQDWERCLDYFNGCCAVCDRPLYGILHTAHADHWIALSDPACPGTIQINMVCLCGGADGCNQSKGIKTAKVWLIEKFGKTKASKIAKRIEEYFDWVRKQE